MDHDPVEGSPRPSSAPSKLTPRMPCRTAAPKAGSPPLANAGPAHASVAQATLLYARKPHETPRLAGANGVLRALQHAMPRANRPPPARRATTTPGPTNGDRRRNDAKADGATRSPNPITNSRTPPMLKMRASHTDLFISQKVHVHSGNLPRRGLCEAYRVQGQPPRLSAGGCTRGQAAYHRDSRMPSAYVADVSSWCTTTTSTTERSTQVTRTSRTRAKTNHAPSRIST